jgi:hypothetical protein
MNTILSGAIGLIIIAAVLSIFFRIRRRARRGGAAETAAYLGSTYELQGRDGKRAIETIVELKAGKKLEEQESGERDDETDSFKSTEERGIGT